MDSRTFLDFLPTNFRHEKAFLIQNNLTNFEKQGLLIFEKLVSKTAKSLKSAFNYPNNFKNEGFKKYFFEDPNAKLEGLNKGIWNVSVLSLLKELTSAIKENRKLKHGSTFEDGLKNQLVVDSVMQSTKDRKWIDI